MSQQREVIVNRVNPFQSVRYTVREPHGGPHSSRMTGCPHFGSDG